MLKSVLKILLQFLFRIKVVGEYKDQNGHTIIIANHQSFLDGLILGVMLPVSPVFVVNTQISQRPLLRWIMSLGEYLVVDPSSPMAIKAIIKLIEGGRPVVIFPEGRITTTGSLMKIYEGSAFVAAKTAATILPVIIHGGTFSALSRMHQEHPTRWFPRITLTYCQSATLKIDDHLSSHDRRYKAGEEMRALLQRSLFESRPRSDLFEAFVASVSLFGKSHKIVEDTKQIEYTYRQVLMMSLELGKLLSHHTKPQENVGVLMPTAVPALALIFGLSAMGRIPAILNFTADIEELQNACDGALVKTIISSKAFIEQAKLESKLDALKNIRILYLEDLKPTMSLMDKLWLMGYAIHFPRAATVLCDPASAAVILFTSGFEGLAKGVVLSHDAILANISQIRAIIDFSTDDKVLNALPIFNSFGLTAGTLLPILGGIPLFMYPSPLHYRIIPEIAYDRSCTVLFGTNTFLNNYAKNAHPYDFYKMRHVIAGAEKLSEGVRDLWFEKFGIRIFEGYGATETASLIAINTQMAFRSGTVGQLLPGIQHTLVPVAGIHNGGVLHVKGPNVMSGYLRASNPGVLEKPSCDAGDGWYDTGDIVSIDSDGYIRIQGRLKHLVNDLA